MSSWKGRENPKLYPYLLKYGAIVKSDQAAVNYGNIQGLLTV